MHRHKTLGNDASHTKRDDTSNGFSIGCAAPSRQVEQISANFDNHNLTEG
jgi:hypothetical protein